MTRRRTLGGAGTAFPALAAIVAAVGLSPADSGAAMAAATTQGAKRKRLVVSPRPRRVVRSHRVPLRVRLRGLSGVLRARLNGSAGGPPDLASLGDVMRRPAPQRRRTR